MKKSKKNRPMYALRSDKEILAISEDSDILNKYLITRVFNSDRVFLDIYKGESSYKKIMRKYSDKIVYNYEGYPLFENEIMWIEEHIEFERVMIRSDSKKLRSYSALYNMKKSERNVLLKASDLLRSKSKSKNIRDFIDIDYILRNKTFIKDLQELDSRFKFLISDYD